MVSRKLKPETDDDCYIKGYFHDRIERGIFPNFRLPPSRLPEVPDDAVMEVESSFVAALRNSKKRGR